MNKFLVYTVIAILLGTITMVAPLALLEQPVPVPESKFTVSEGNEETLQRGEMLEAPEATLGASSDDDQKTYGEPPEETVWCDTNLSLADAASGLSSIGLLVVPSFLVALGVFVYIKKRVD
ncbi:MAG: hypothetical protein CW691_11935 [Candidatus Bathyarchaeum sp.]|nr:MAG: hypothetical protein CW691_11935 [Candidatus Bathyarchaeum sp.]